MQKYTKTRIAPTPSGFLHFGNIASFVLTIGLARKYGAKVLLRIDDLDQKRVRKEYIDNIFETLRFLDLPWDEGPRDTDDFIDHYSQMRRLDLYQDNLDRLLDSGQVFACCCSRKQILEINDQLVYSGTCLKKNIPVSENDVSWRLKTKTEEVAIIHHLGGEKIICDIPEEMKFVVLRKKDGFPSYQLSSLVDDVFFDIDLIVRGEDLLHSSIIQHHIAHKLGKPEFCQNTFLHHPLIPSSSGEKLSKSSGATSIHYMRKRGYTTLDVWQAIGRSCGMTETASNWEDLFLHLEQKWIK